MVSAAIAMKPPQQHKGQRTKQYQDQDQRSYIRPSVLRIHPCFLQNPVSVWIQVELTGLDVNSGEVNGISEH
jgi:hypothetical protein